MNNERKSYGLWLKTSSKGNQYAVGKITINGVTKRVYLFKNEKKNDKQPDFSILV